MTVNNQGNSVHRLTGAGLALALALVLPFLTGQIPEVGSMLCPMHLPVLLCGFVCGGPWGLAVGAIAPILRSLLFSRPPMFSAIPMAFELAAYGAVAGFLYRKMPKTKGSIYATLIAAMNNGFINAETEIEDLGLFTAHNFNRSCLLWSSARATHQFINAKDAIRYSCNYFFYELGNRMTWEHLNEVAAAFGLGEPTGVELPENIGWRANPESKRKQYGEGSLDGDWFPGDQINSAIGQSENRYTPLQLCVYACTLANRGTRMSATFLNRVVSSDYRTLVRENQPKVISTFEICNDAYVSYMEGMQKVIYEQGGTARKIFNGFEDTNPTFPSDIRVCAKTGTAQTFETWSDHGAFICFAPADNPQIAIALYGERIAHPTAIAEVAEHIMKAYFTAERASAVEVYENKLS